MQSRCGPPIRTSSSIANGLPTRSPIARLRSPTLSTMASSVMPRRWSATGPASTCRERATRSSSYRQQRKGFGGVSAAGCLQVEGRLDLNGYLYGGLVDNESGVLLSVPNSQQMDLESAEALVLNTGAASAATDYTGTPLVTPAGLWLTFYVPRDEACFAGTTPIESNSCSAETNATVKVAGTSAMNIRGVITRRRSKSASEETAPLTRSTGRSWAGRSNGVAVRP